MGTEEHKTTIYVNAERTQTNNLNATANVNCHLIMALTKD